jgi:hypothetical protein
MKKNEVALINFTPGMEIILTVRRKCEEIGIVTGGLVDELPSPSKPKSIRIMNLQKLFAISMLAGTVAGAGSTANAVVLLGSPYTPTGANYQISAVQGVDASNPLGKSGFSPQVNRDFEFQGATGVSYDNGSGTLTNFGIGLYAGPGNVTQSTGLRFDFNTQVTASSIVVKVEDFDIKAGKDAFFNPNKVEPTIVLLGLNNAILGIANPHDIFPNLVATTGGAATGDTWNINLGNLLNLGDSAISGFILAADMAAGEKPNSDPYLAVSIGNGIPTVPEADTYFAGLFGIGIAVVSVVRSMKRRHTA